MMLEDDLRTTLRERAAEPAVQPDLLTEVRGGIRRSQRRRAAVLAAAALVVTAIAVPLTLRNGPGPAPVPGSSPAAWVANPRFDLPLFPFTPGWVPPGLGVARVDQVGPNVVLNYDTTDAGLTVEVGPKPAAWEAEGDDHKGSVNGIPATVRTVAAGVYEGSHPGDRYVGVRWKLADGRWAQLISSGPGTEAEVLRFAQALRPGALPASPLPFTVATAPPGLVLQRFSAGQMCLAPPAAVADRDGNRGICLGVSTGEGDEEPFEGEEPVTVGGREGLVSRPDDTETTLSVRLGAGRALTVDVNLEDVPLTREELIRFAAGVTVA